jgi:C1A family cysteine protease
MLNSILLLLLMTSGVFGATYTQVKGADKFQEAPEYQLILAQIKLLGNFSTKEVLEPKKMSRGEQVVAEAKARTRAIIAEQNKVAKKSEDTDSNLSDLEKLKIEDKKIRDGWKKEVLDQRKLWQKEQDIFLGRIKIYKENTFEIPVKKEVIVEKKVIEGLPEVHIVNSSFKVQVKDQYNRPTCSAFAGVRAVEILLAQNNQPHDLSEQYFYWASKPDCREKPCKEKGSWVNQAYRYSQKHSSIDIPSESNCNYEGSSLEKNETQLPLSKNCEQGIVKVLNFEDVRTLADVVEKIKNNIPVIMAAKLSENFYKNSGLVTLKESSANLGVGLDRHALGHAFVGVGVIELPEKARAQEGRFCIVIANSWGKGWGAGGYSCLTENWLVKYRQPAPFVSVTRISTK